MADNVQHITRASLGYTAQIGDLYDVKSEKLLHGVNIFNKRLPNDVVITTDAYNIDSTFVYSSKISEKFKALDVSGELTVSIMAGLIKGSGSVNYLNEITNNESAVQYSFVQKIRTVEEKININDNNLKDMVASNFDDHKATHVVIGVAWGANAAVTMTHCDCEEKDKAEIKGKLAIAFEKLKGVGINVSGKGEVKHNTADNEILKGVNLKVNADMLPTGMEAPTNLTSAMEFLQSMVRQFTDKNSKTKGKQLEFFLMPLKVIQKVFGFQKVCDRVLNDINEGAIKRLEQFFENISETTAMLQDLVRMVNNNGDFITIEDKNAIKTCANDFEVDVCEMRRNLGVLLKEVRSGKKEAYEIEVLRSVFMDNPKTSTEKINLFVESFKSLKGNIEFKKECQRTGVELINEIIQLADFKRLNQDREIYMLFCSFKNDRVSPKFTESFLLLLSMKKNMEHNVAAIVDTDIAPDIVKSELLPNGIRVVKYFNGRYLCSDCLEESRNMNSQCLTKCDQVNPYNFKEIKKAVSINFPCPKSIGYGKCSKDNKEWFCSHCRQPICYNFDGFFYCKCGRNYAHEFAYKCSDKMHGNEFAKYSSEILEDLIKSVKPLPEVNILVIGETGVGKSTFINALANYINYETAAEALQNDLINLIPTQFELTQKNCDGEITQKVIRIGKSENENFTEGQSATQKSKAYAFCHNQTYYRIIDTPGIGDSRGNEQDMQNVMDFLSCFKEIHGICILMKPNDSRITTSFEFCFKQLLVQFHRSAVENIVFCFTQTFGHGFKVAQTLTPLKKLLNEIKQARNITIPTTVDRLYAFDNAAYRYICAAHKGEEFSPEQKEVNENCYKISRKASQKMLEYFLTQNAHCVEDSLSVNCARNVILQLSYPMALISASVQEALAKNKEKQALIKKYENDEKELRKILIKRIPIKKWKLEYYDKKYCERCSAQALYYGNDRLHFVEADAYAMNEEHYSLTTPKNYLENWTDLCPTCEKNTRPVKGTRWLSWSLETREEEDVTEAARLKEKLETKKGVEEEIINVNNTVRAMEKEMKILVETSAKFARFLHAYSITPYNDATENYLNMLIQNAEHSGQQDKRKNYENLLRQYEKEKEILDRSLRVTEDFPLPSITTSTIMASVDTLTNLYYYGDVISKAIKKMNEMENYAEEIFFSGKDKKTSSYFKKIKSKFNTVKSKAGKIRIAIMS